MFGKPQQNNNPANNSNNGASASRTAAEDLAQIQGGGLVQIIVTGLLPLTFFLFLNDQQVDQMDVESINIAIDAPDASGAGGSIRATLSRYVSAVTGGKTQQRTELFPSTIEMLALKRRLSVSCQNPNSFEGLYLSLGLNPDGTDNELKGVQSLNVLLTEGILDAKISWVEGGKTENIFPPA